MIRGARHSQAWALPRSTGCQPVCLPGSRGGLLRSTGCQPVCRSGLQWARDCPCHLAGRSLRASCPALTRRKPRFALQASLGFLRRSIGTGSPSRPLVAQVFNLCVFPFRSALLRVPPIRLFPLPESNESDAGARGCPCPRASYGSKRSQDGEAQRTCSESRPGGPRRTSSERARAAPRGHATGILPAGAGEFDERPHH